MPSFLSFRRTRSCRGLNLDVSVGSSFSRVAGGLCRSVWALGPTTTSSAISSVAPPSPEDVAATLTVAFGALSALAIFAPFPIATLPMLTGKVSLPLPSALDDV